MSTNYEKELEQMLHSKPIKALLIAISIHQKLWEATREGKKDE